MVYLTIKRQSRSTEESVQQHFYSSMDVTPLSYFNNMLGNKLVNILTECSEQQPNSPLDFIAESLERVHYSNTINHINAMLHNAHEEEENAIARQPKPASLYFQNTFGSSLHQAVKDTLNMRPRKPLNFIADHLERFVKLDKREKIKLKTKTFKEATILK